MNQQKITAVRKYLYQSIEEHLANKASALSVATQTNFTEDMKELHKLFTKAETHVKAYAKAIDNLRRTISDANIKAYISGSANVSAPGFRLNSSNRQFAFINNNQSFYCNEQFIDDAKKAVREVDKFLIQLMLDGDSSSVEEFRSNLLRQF
jgi:hypothetical protein